MVREILNEFNGENNVTKIKADNGSVSYLTPSVSFNDAAYAKGACKLNTVENEKKHVLFLFNADDAEVGRFYLGKKLQGKTPSQIVELKHQLYIFKSFNATTENWVPCIGLFTQESLSKTAVTF